MKDVIVTVKNGSISEEEKEAYIRYVRGKNTGKQLYSIEIELDGEYVNLVYRFKPSNFERLRRITGYLVGTLDRWNNGKRAEEKDRVTHSTMEKI